MKRTKKFITAAIMMMAAIVIFHSCKKSESAQNYNSDKSKLSLVIDTATALYDTTKAGKQENEYPLTSRTALTTAISLANSVTTGNTFTQQQVNNALANLKRVV